MFVGDNDVFGRLNIGFSHENNDFSHENNDFSAENDVFSVIESDFLSVGQNGKVLLAKNGFLSVNEIVSFEDKNFEMTGGFFDYFFKKKF